MPNDLLHHLMTYLRGNGADVFTVVRSDGSFDIVLRIDGGYAGREDARGMHKYFAEWLSNAGVGPNSSVPLKDAL